MDWTVAHGDARPDVRLRYRRRRGSHDALATLFWAGQVWNEDDANPKCLFAAIAVQGRWTGVWQKTRQGEASVCEVVN